ncbi:hypothetical protein BH09VER1_BH09VER1_19320 [soil metagenome]
MNCRRDAFSLIEMLVVIAIILILAVGLIPAMTSITRAYQLTASTDNLVGGLMLGRQSALTRGAAVQVRLYKLPDYNQSETTGALMVYRGLQCFVEGDVTVTNGTNLTTLIPITRPIYFKSPVVVLNDAARSTILSLTNSQADLNLPPYNKNYQFISFRFKPNGQTDLADTANTLTVVLQNDALVNGGFPLNFRTVRIGSPSGIVQSYRP